MQRFFASKVSGVLNTIKDALPNFEDDEQENCSSSYIYKSGVNTNLDESIKSTALKSTKSFLLPDFFTTSNTSTPYISPSIDIVDNSSKEKSGNNEDPAQNIGFKFLPCDIEVRITMFKQY